MNEQLTPSMYQNILAVTNRHLVTGDFLSQVERVCSLHPKALIVREKDLPEKEYEALTGECLRICGLHNISCVIHFYPEAAVNLGCPNLHLPLWKLEECTKTHKNFTKHFQKIGISVHSVEEAMRAYHAGASYLCAGHIYATDCKKGVPPRGLSFLTEVCRSIPIPVYGIGGIQLDEAQIREVMACGAAGGCVMSGMMRVI